MERAYKAAVPAADREADAAAQPSGAWSLAGAPAPAVAKIRIQSLSKVFRLKADKIVAAQDVSLDVAEGEFVAIVGPSGCGKSTLLRILAGLEQHTTGDVSIRRRSGDRPLLNMVFQEQSAFPWMTVGDNVAYGLRIRRVDERMVKEQVDYWLEATGLTRFRDAYPHQLSSGMKQRVSIARAFANDPEILLMDEPFAALDALTKMVLQGELLALWESTRKTVVYVTHSLEEALTLSDKVVVMSARPGTVKAVLPLPFARPRDGIALKADPRYAEIYAHVWRLLEEEVVKPQVRDAH
jgi:NitT/TauT family transport system ATP-binding protein